MEGTGAKRSREHKSGQHGIDSRISAGSQGQVGMSVYHGSQVGLLYLAGAAGRGALLILQGPQQVDQVLGAVLKISKFCLDTSQLASSNNKIIYFYYFCDFTLSLKCKLIFQCTGTGTYLFFAANNFKFKSKLEMNLNKNVLITAFYESDCWYGSGTCWYPCWNQGGRAVRWNSEGQKRPRRLKWRKPTTRCRLRDTGRLLPISHRRTVQQCLVTTFQQ